MTTPYFVEKHEIKYSQYKLGRYRCTELESIHSNSIPEKRHLHSLTTLVQYTRLTLS